MLPCCILDDYIVRLMLFLNTCARIFDYINGRIDICLFGFSNAALSVNGLCWIFSRFDFHFDTYGLGHLVDQLGRSVYKTYLDVISKQ